MSAPTPSTDAAHVCYPEDYKLMLNGDHLVPAKFCGEWEKIARALEPLVREYEKHTWFDKATPALAAFDALAGTAGPSGS